MAQVADVKWHVTGDIGGTGTSIFRWTSATGGNVTAAQAQVVANALEELFTTMALHLPSQTHWNCDSLVDVWDVDTGLVQGALTLGTTPAQVSGVDQFQYGAGLGARLNWHTSTVAGRHVLRGCNFIVPLGSTSYGAGGSVSATVTTALQQAGTAYIAALQTGGVYPVIWHRPKKGTQSGGVIGVVHSASVSSQPAGLRSRRS